MHQHTCRVGTARIHYRGEKHQTVLNTTVKSGSGLGKVFAPTWHMVMAFKHGDIDWPTYTTRYQALMRERYRQNLAPFLEALSGDELIVCCYCKDTHATTRHCHRYLLVDLLEKVAHHHRIRFERIGEMCNSRSLSGCFYFQPDLTKFLAGVIMNPIIIHTDGSCETQTRLGGWAAILQCGDHRRELSGSAVDTTVNIMELTAVIEALSALKRNGAAVQIITDSNYVVKGVNEWLPDWIGRGWKTAGKKPVANRELWEQLQGLLAQHKVTFTWVPREQNADADKLAQAARIAQTTATQPPTLPTPIPRTTQIMIAGSRYATREMLDYARKVVRRAHAKGYTIVIGDNPKGVDMAVVQECRRLKAKVLVVGVTNRPRNGGCSHGGYVKVERDTYRAMSGDLLDQYTVRDRWMVDNATFGIFVWNGDSRGTKQGHDYMVSRSKEAHLITFEKGARRG